MNTILNNPDYLKLLKLSEVPEASLITSIETPIKVEAMKSKNNWGAIIVVVLLVGGIVAYDIYQNSKGIKDKQKSIN
jgi:hypothetical protein